MNQCISGISKLFQATVEQFVKGPLSFDLHAYGLSAKLDPCHDRDLDQEWPPKALRQQWMDGEFKMIENLQLAGVLYTTVPLAHQRWDFVLSNGFRSNFTKGLSTKEYMFDLTGGKFLKKVEIWLYPHPDQDFELWGLQFFD